MKQKGKLVVLLVLVALLVGLNLRRESSSVAGAMPTGAPATDRAREHVPLATPEGILTVQPERPLGRQADRSRNIFQYASLRPPPERQPRVEAPNVQPAAPPRQPPAPVRFYGFAEVNRGGERRVFLTNGEEIFIAREGDVILKRYRVARVGKERIELEELAGEQRWVVPLEQP